MNRTQRMTTKQLKRVHRFGVKRIERGVRPHSTWVHAALCELLDRIDHKCNRRARREYKMTRRMK